MTALAWKAAIPLIFAAAAAGHAFAGRGAPPPPDCRAPEYRQFDFWLGEWNVTTPDGRTTGTNRISRILKDCVLLEEWTGASGSSGRSFNTWSRADGRWHQTWVSDNGTHLRLSGGLRDGAMILEGDVARDGAPVMRHRITWTPLGRDRVRQHWQQSTDAGSTWTTVFDGTYSRQRS